MWSRDFVRKRLEGGPIRFVIILERQIFQKYLIVSFQARRNFGFADEKFLQEFILICI